MSFETSNGDGRPHKLERGERARERSTAAYESGLQQGWLLWHISRQTNDPRHREAAVRKLRQAEEHANLPRSKEQWVSAVQGIVTPERLATLVGPTGVLKKRGGNVMTTLEDGSIVNASGNNEGDRLAAIRKRLEALTPLSPDSKDTDLTKKKTYLQPWRGGWEVDMSALAADLTWLRAETRIGSSATLEDREAYKRFEDVILDLIELNTPENMQKFIARNPRTSVTGALLGKHVYNLDETKDATKFALVLAVGAFFVFSGIRDAMGKKLSWSTLLLGGVLLYLFQNGSKFDFLAGSQFERLSKGPLTDDAANRLRSYAAQNPKAYRHMIRVMEEERNADAVDARIVDRLLHPKRKQGGEVKEDRARVVDPYIANLFLGMHPGDVAEVMKNLPKVKENEDWRSVLQVTKAYNTGNEDVKRDIQSVLSAPSGSAFTPSA